MVQNAAELAAAELAAVETAAARDDGPGGAGAARPSLPSVQGGPEQSFRLRPITVAGRVVTASMPSGPWLIGPGGVPGAGSLGVLLDDALGYALLLDRAPGRWSVSAEITVDVFRPVPADGSMLTARGRALSLDSAGGLSSGEILDAAGQVIAVCHQHGRWIPDTGIPPSAFDSGPPPSAAADGAAADSAAANSAAADGAADLAELLGVRPQAADGGAQLDLTVTPELANPLGNLHGGVTFSVCDLLAQAALAALGRRTDTASLHVAYARALPLGTVVRFGCSVVHPGRSFTITQITAVTEAGKPAIIATATTR